MREDNIQELQEHLLKEYGNNVILEINIMYVNSVPFLITTSWHLRIVTAHRLKNRHANTILDALDITLRLYRIRGLEVKQIFADDKFELIRKELLKPLQNIALNTTIKDEYCPYVEREIQTFKERCQACCAYVNFDHFPKTLTVEMVMAMVHWINCVPRENSASKTMSPQMI